MLLRLRLGWLLVLVLCYQVGTAQPAAWQRVALDSVATLEFPDSVSRRQEQGFLIYSCAADSTVFLAMSKPTSSFAGLLSNSPRFYDGMVQQWLREVDGKLRHRQAITVGTCKGVEIEFATPKNPALPATKFTRMVVVNSTVYILNCWTNATPATALAERTRFFSSFHLKAQPAAQSSAYQLGRLLGSLVAYAVLLMAAIGLAVGGILLLRRRNKSKI